MPIEFNNLIQNGSFETGDLSFWSGYNASVTFMSVRKVGVYSAILEGTQYAALLQTIPVVPGESYILNASFSKTSNLANDQVNIYVRFYDAGYNFISTGLFTYMTIGT